MISRLGLSVLSFFMAGAILADEPPKPADKPDAKAAVDQESKAQTKPDSTRPLSPGDAELLKALEKQTTPGEEEENPLLRVGQRMRDVQGRLVKADSGDETQNLQKGIVQDIDKLIEEIKKGGT